MNTMKLELITPNQHHTHEHVQYVSLPSIQGECGVLPHHTTTILALENGILTYTIGNEKHKYTITRGIASINATSVRVLTESVTS